MTKTHRMLTAVALAAGALALAATGAVAAPAPQPSPVGEVMTGVNDLTQLHSLTTLIEAPAQLVAVADPVTALIPAP